MAERLAILISGSGTTMQEMIVACKYGKIPIEVACVIASTAAAGGIEKAERLGIPKEDIIVIDPENFRGENKKINRTKFGLSILKELQSRRTTVVTQNGWMPWTPDNVIDAFPDKIFNQHPGPPDHFGGSGMHGIRVYAAMLFFHLWTKSVSWTEVVAQRVHPEVDKGEVVKSMRVAILPGDTPEDLQKRALPVEHMVQLALLRDIVHGRVQTHKDRWPLPPIVQPGQEEIAELAKQKAIEQYP